ncbi:MAG: xanthine dehydrogenase family protein molybdopterin-binding subunit [Deltaproteobacteria bacterium]|nr:xanthine dehydrogenase family protein molybdopterin-binding subunit [Deltaproteobacteria bacterium]
MATTSAPQVGASLPRVDGDDKVKGTALYVDDLTLPGMLHAATVRSSCAHGILEDVVLDPGYDWTGITVATAADIPGDNTVLLIETDQPCLVPVGGTIMHPDEPVAVVAAPTRAKAFEAAKHVQLKVRELPGLFDVEEALASDTKLYGDGNLFKEFNIRKGRGDDIDAVLAECDLVVEGTYRTGAQEQMYIEPQGMIASWDGDTCTITGSLQCPYYVHKAMKPLLEVDDDHVVVRQSVTGGGFGGKEEYPSMIAGHAAIVSKKAGAPVKLVYDRDEDIGATTKRHPSLVRHRLGLSKDGRVVACDVDVIIDGGAYLTLSPVVLSRAVLHASGPYKFDHVRIRGRAVATNHPPHGAFRGFGAPQTTFAYERQMDKAARQLGIEPFELRENNMIRLGDQTATSQTLAYSVGSDKVLAAVKEQAGKAPEQPAESHLRRGRGLAFYFHGAGFTGSGEERLAGRATVALCSDGHFEIRSSSTDIGQGALTTFVQIAAAALGVDPERVETIEPDTAKVPDSGPTVASRTCMVVGAVVDRASQALKARIEKWAADHGKDGSIGELATAMAEAEGEVAETAQYQPPPGIHWDDDTYTGSAYPVYGWAACLVDVTVDLDSYEVDVDRCIHAVDVGKAIHPIIVKGQIEGGTLQALGWALWENVIYDHGRVVNRTMTNCIVPTFADAPELETILVEEPYPFGPHGAKGVGEIPMDGPAAAVAAAVSHATGVDFDRLPILPEAVEAALSAKEPS